MSYSEEQCATMTTMSEEIFVYQSLFYGQMNMSFTVYCIYINIILAVAIVVVVFRYYSTQTKKKKNEKEEEENSNNNSYVVVPTAYNLYIVLFVRIKKKLFPL